MGFVFKSHLKCLVIAIFAMSTHAWAGTQTYQVKNLPLKSGFASLLGDQATWAMWSVASAGGYVNFPTDGTYLFTLESYMTPSNADAAMVQVFIDDQLRSTVPILFKTLASAQVGIAVRAGVHKMSFRFPNDDYQSATVDRNLFLKTVHITSPALAPVKVDYPLTVVEAPRMGARVSGAYVEADGSHVRLSPNQAVAQAMHFPTSGYYYFHLNGARVAGVFALAKVSIDNSTIGTIAFPTHAETSRSALAYVVAGTHVVGVRGSMGIVRVSSLSIVAPVSTPANTPVGSNFTVTHDTNVQHVTAENENYKIVWQYGSRIPEEKFDQGGGNIYSLYDKTKPSGATRNLLAQDEIYGYDGGTAPNKPGAGGLGATKVYYQQPEAYSSTRKNCSIWGTPIKPPRFGTYHTAYDHGYRSNTVLNSITNNPTTGILTVVFTSEAQDLSEVPVYRVKKTWTVSRAGEIDLKYDWTFLRSLSYNEPSYNFSFNPDYGFTTMHTLAHNWSEKDPGADGLHTARNTIATYPLGQHLSDIPNHHAQTYLLVAPEDRRSISVSMYNGNRGTESGGLFLLGYQLWCNRTDDGFTNEASMYMDKGARAHTLRWHSWWGGLNDASNPERYRYIPAGKTFSDSLKIRFHN